MRKLLFFIMLFPFALLAQGGPFMCGSWAPIDKCDSETGNVTQAHGDILTADGYEWIETIDHHEPPAYLDGEFLNIKRLHLYATPDGSLNTSVECSQFCPKVASCGDGWAVGEGGICYELTKGPYDCANIMYPWVSGETCDPVTGELLQSTIEEMGSFGWVYQGPAESYSYVVELHHEIPPTSYQKLRKAFEWSYANNPDSKHLRWCSKQCPQMYPCDPGFELDSMLRCSPMVCDEGFIVEGRECVADTGGDIPPVDPPADDPVDIQTVVSDNSQHVSSELAATAAGEQARQHGDDHSQYGGFLFTNGGLFEYGDLEQNGMDSLTDAEVIAEAERLTNLRLRPRGYVHIKPAGEAATAPDQADYARAQRIFQLTGITRFYIYTSQNTVVQHGTTE